MQKRPHIIIFNPDEMRASTLAHLGNPAAITPNLDTFAENDAVSFSNAYCQNPVCVPSRCSFFTGLYPHTTGHRTMSYLLRPGEPTLLSELKDAGYHVWMNDRNDLCASQYKGWVESHADEIFYPGKVKKAPGLVNPGQRGEPGGKYYYSHFGGELKTDEDGINYNTDDETIDAAITRLSQWKEGDAPLCMFLGLHNPHTPYQIEEPYFSAIDRSKLPHRIRPEECSNKSKMMELYRNYQNLDGLTEEEWDELRAVYQGMCMKIDVQFGRLCEGLKKAGIYDDSAIFVFSDHGDFAGDYGMAEKAQNCFEDCLTKVPFLIKPPKGMEFDPGVSDSLVELVDFYATALDFAGVPSSHTHFGQSLRTVLEDRQTTVRDYVFCEGGRLPNEPQCDEYHQEGGRVAKTQEEYWPKKMAQCDDEAHAKAIMIRGERYKYISRSAGQDELYDLVNDPNETTNVIDNPELVCELQKLQIALMKWLQRTSDIVPTDYDRRFTTESLMSKVGSIVAPEDREKVVQFIESGATIGEVFGYAFSLRRKEENMKKQGMNPFLPLSEYVPDGEPRVFGNRLYLYGSHDEAGATQFCVKDYVVYSAPLDDLTDWRYEGVSYSYEDSLASLEEAGNLAAPDCIQGPDGKYYLYYNRGKRLECEVAVSDKPQGPFRYLGEVTYKDGTKPDKKLFDPGVLIDDDGKIYLYTGFVPTPDSPWINIADRYSHAFELEEDMLTIKSGPYEVLPGCLASKGTEYEGHAFYEASSPRKINGKYYLVYSSDQSHDLCYAVSDHPIEGYHYGGVLVSNADIGYNGNTIAKAPYGNTHGGLVNVNDTWYIFYHRQTHGIECCRQACAEVITLSEDGTFKQVEMTSCGLNGGPLEGTGTYKAAYACNLMEAKPWEEKLTIRKCVRDEHVHIYEESNEKETIQFIANMQSGTKAGFKYFKLGKAKKISIMIKSHSMERSTGNMQVFLDEACTKKIADLVFDVNNLWTNVEGELVLEKTDEFIAPLYFKVECNNPIDWLEFVLL